MKISRKIIASIAILTLLSGNLVFAEENTSSCKEEIIENASNPVFSSDGKSFAYVKKKDGKYVIIKDGIEIGKEYDNSYNPVYSPDGKGFAYIVSEKGKNFIIKDGQKIGPYKYVYLPKYSPDGKSFAYIVAENLKYFIVKDGVEFGKENGVFLSNIIILGFGGKNTFWGDLTPMIYSPDGKSFAYLGRKDGKIIVVKDGVESDKYDSASDLIYSPDGKSFAYLAKKNNKQIIIKDNLEISEKYQYFHYPIYSPDGKEFVYLAKRKDGEHFREFIVRNGVEVGKEYESVSGPLIYSPDSKKFTFGAEKDGEWIIVENKTEILNKYGGWVDNLIYSPNNKSLIYRVVKAPGTGSEKSFIVKNGVEVGKEYKKIIDFKYSPDGKSFVYVGEKEDKKTYLVILPCDNQNSNQESKKEEIKKETPKNLDKDTSSQGEKSKQITIKSKNLLAKDLLISKKELENGKYKNYKNQIDTLVSKITDTQLIAVYKRLETIKSTDKKDLKNFVLYFKAKVGIEFYKREDIEKVSN